LERKETNRLPSIQRVFFMTDQLALFLACFSHFHLVLIQNRGVLEQLLMVFETFCNGFYLSHVILVFPEI